jgi:CBS domain-containing protein
MVQTKSLGNTAAGIHPLHLSEERVKVLSTRPPLTVESGTPLRQAIETMQAREGDCVLVLRDGRLAGILTERDVLTRVLGRADPDLDAPVDESMTADPRTLSPEASVREAMEQMEEGHFRNLPLVDDAGRLHGLLRQQDVLGYVAEAFPQEILNLPPRPHQQMDAPEGA